MRSHMFPAELEELQSKIVRLAAEAEQSAQDTIRAYAKVGRELVTLEADIGANGVDEWAEERLGWKRAWSRRVRQLARRWPAIEKKMKELPAPPASIDAAVGLISKPRKKARTPRATPLDRLLKNWLATLEQELTLEKEVYKRIEKAPESDAAEVRIALRKAAELTAKFRGDRLKKEKKRADEQYAEALFRPIQSLAKTRK